MGILWEVLQTGMMYGQKRKSDSVEDRVQFLENQLESTRNTLRELVKKIEETAHQIALSSREQSEGIAQISQAVGELSKTGMEVSAQSEELATAASQMASRSARFRRASIVWVIHSGEGGGFRSDLRRSSDSANRSEINRPRDLPSFLPIDFRSFRMGSSMSTVVRMAK